MVLVVGDSSESFDINIPYHDFSADFTPVGLKQHTDGANFSFNSVENHITMHVTVTAFDEKRSSRLYSLENLQKSFNQFFQSQKGAELLKKHYHISEFDKAEICSLIDETPNKGNSFVRCFLAAPPKELPTTYTEAPGWIASQHNKKNVFYRIEKSKRSDEKLQFYRDRCFLRLRVKDKKNNLHHVRVKLDHIFEQ